MNAAAPCAFRLASRRSCRLGSLLILLLALAGCQRGAEPEARDTEPARGAAVSEQAAERSGGRTVERCDGTCDGPPAAAREDAGTAAARRPRPIDLRHVTPVALEAGAARPADRGPPLDGWHDPQLVLLLTGRQDGYIEPCGCTGLENAKGGLARRHTLVRQLEERGWPVVALDMGSQVRRFGRQAEIKFQMTVEGLKTIGYQTITLGPVDLQLSLGELVATLVASQDDDATPFVTANATILDPSFTRPYHVIEAAGQRVGVTAVLGPEQRRVLSDEIEFQDAAEALDELWPRLEAESCDVYVLLVHADVESSRELARRFPQFQLVITSGGPVEPPLLPEFVSAEVPSEVAGNASQNLLIELGGKAMQATAIGVFDDPEQPIRYARVPLDSRFGDSPEMLDLLAAYQNQLKQLGLDGLGLRGVVHPSGNTFVGSAACADCHDYAYSVWKDSPHAKATESLVYPSERGDIPRHHDPECLSCHVTGWNPQQFFPYASGFFSLEEDVHLFGNGCENCHGPGSAHVAAEWGEVDVTPAQQQMLREQMRLPLEVAEQRCLECHDIDNDPHFHEPGAFERYWRQIEH